MSLQTFIARLEREQRKARRQRVRTSVRAYRERKRAAGFRRVELFLSEQDYRTLFAYLNPGESISAALSRILTGNRESAKKAQWNQP